MAKAKKETTDEPKRGRKIMLTDAKGNEIARVDVIKDLYHNQGKKRSEIVKILKEEYDHEVKYQIVFAATKPAKDAKDADGEKEAA